MKKKLLIAFVIGFSTISYGQLVSKNPINQRGDKNNFQKGTVSLGEIIKKKSSTYVITAQHTSKVSGITHIYLRQAIQGLEVSGTESSIHLDAQGNTISSHNNFIENISNTVKQSNPLIDQEEAIRSVAAKMSYSISNLTLIEPAEGINQKALFNKAGISTAEIPVKLMYLYQQGKGTKQVWELSIQESNSSDWWNFMVDATNGAILSKENLTISCFNDNHNHDDDYINESNKEPALFYTVENNPSLMVGSYGVVPMPYESPGHSPNQNVLISVANPDNATASPFGWHDTNGSPGSEFTRTQGNNCSAYDDDNNTNSPSTAADYAEGGAGLNFTGFSYSPTYSSGNQSEDAAVTNLFYWTNIIHDVVYQYGFDEASGNFQENNYGNGGAGSDSVNSEAQDGSGTCNANFGTPTDGGNPRMQMYTCGSRDGDFDNGVIVHEYGHGISTRLTGGPGNSSCLNNQEQMGEGWSDYYALMLTMESGDAGTDSRGIGTWLIGEGPTGDGIRTYPYSTNFAINPHTYDDIITEVAPHGVGSVWCAMLWEMTWELIADHGFTTDFYTFTGNPAVDAGNIQALAIVTEALKLQPCSPGFVSGRDAILLADQNIYGGANQCAIWDAFARRGLGFSATQGSTNNKSDGGEAFDLPPGTASFNSSVSAICITEGIQTGLSGGAPSGGVYSGSGVTDDGNGLTYTFDPNIAGVGTATVTYTVLDACSGGIANLNDTIEVSDGTPNIICQDITITLDAAGNAVLDPFANQATLIGGNNGSNNPGFSALVTTPSQNVSISFDWDFSTVDDPDFDSFGYILGTSYIALSDGSTATQSGTFSIDLTAGTQFGFCTFTADNTFGAATGVVSNFAPGFIGQFAAANFTEIQQESDGSATIDFVNALAVLGSCNSTSFSGQTAFSCLDVGTKNVTFTITDDINNESTTCTSTITVLPNPAQLTTFTAGTWSNGTPTSSSIAIFNGAYDTATHGDINACSCQINTGNTVTVQANDYMNIQGNITVDGTLIVQHQGSLVQVDNDATVVNNGTINVNLTTPNLASRDFMILGSPMSSESRTDVWNSAFLVLNHDTNLFVPNAAVAAAFPLAENFADDNYNNWIAYNGAINLGEGYIVRPQTGYGQPGGIFNYTYDSGTLNNGIVNFNVLYNTPGTPSENKNASPNILANPYPSAIWANDFINANPMVDEVYFWEHNTPPSPSLPGAGAMNFSMEDISMYNLVGGTAAASGGTAPNGYISTGQGFAIKASAAGTAVFNNSMRRTDNNNTLRSFDESLERIWLTVETPQYEMQSSTLIAFSENATAGIDAGYDSRRMATVVSLYSQLEDSTGEFGIQSREQFNRGMKIPLGFSSLIEEKITYQISIDQLEGANLNNATILLIDMENKTTVNLKDGPYSFTSENGTFADRFYLVFQRGSYRFLEVEQAQLETISLFPNPTQGLLTIASPNTEIEKVRVYDLQGREVLVSSEKGMFITIDLSKVTTSVYFVTVETSLGTITKKVVKK